MLHIYSIANMSKSIFPLLLLSLFLSRFLWSCYVYLLSKVYSEWNDHSYHFVINYNFLQSELHHEIAHNCLHFFFRQGEVFLRSSLICNMCHRHTSRHKQHRTKREAFCAVWRSNDGLKAERCELSKIINEKNVEL